MGALSWAPCICPKARSPVTPELPPAEGARKSGLFGTPHPSPRLGGRGGEEGADGSNYRSDPPPPVARGRKIGFSSFRGREGQRPPRQGAGSGAQVREGTSFPRERGREIPLGKAKPSLPAPALGRLRPVSLQARRL